MKMTKSQLKQCLKWYIISFLGIEIIWELLELDIYGEVQPRVVDRIVAAAFTLVVWAAYFLGRYHEQQMR